MRIMKSAIAAIISFSVFGCSTPDNLDDTAQREAAVHACGLQDDPSITADVDIHACDAAQTKKTTICHIPPGNPANAHTLCVGNAAVRAHVDNHHDTLGPCADEPPCDQGDVDAGVGGGSGSGDGSGSDGGGSGSDGGGVIL